MKNYWLKENIIKNIHNGFSVKLQNSIFRLTKEKRSFFSVTNISNDYLFIEFSGSIKNVVLQRSDSIGWQWHTVNISDPIQVRVDPSWNQIWNEFCVHGVFESAVSIIGNIGQKFIVEQTWGEMNEKLLVARK